MNDDTSPSEAEVVSEDAEPSPKTQLAVDSEILPISLHILPVHERPFFPVHAMPLTLDEKVWLETIVEVGKTPSRTVGLMLTKSTPEQPPTPIRSTLSAPRSGCTNQPGATTKSTL